MTTPPRDSTTSRASILPSITFDLLAGLLAIVLVVGVSIRAAFVGSDLRVMFAVSLAAFYLAGVVRGGTGIANAWLKGLVVSAPGFLGAAALIANDGLHRLPVPVGISIGSIAAAIAGVQTRRGWRDARHQSLLLATTMALVLAVGVPVAVPHLARFASLTRVSRPGPEFQLTGAAGASLGSKEMQGQVVVLAFWASWCTPCRWELPELQAAYEEFRDDPRVRVLAVDVGWGGETPERAKHYLSDQGLSLPTAFDPDDAARALGVDALPTLVVLDAGGRVRMVHHGFDRSERMGEQITGIVRDLLAERGT